jgi:hypothetical protein
VEDLRLAGKYRRAESRHADTEEEKWGRVLTSTDVLSCCFCCIYYLEHCSIRSSSPGQYPLDAKETHSVMRIKVSPDIATCPLGAKPPPTENH